MRKMFVFTVIFLICFVFFAEERKYSIYMMGSRIGTSIEKWSESTDTKGRCILTLESSSNMEINRGSFAITLNSRSVMKADCKKLTPVSVESESSEISSKINSKGIVKDGIFNAEIEKNSNKETFSYKLDNDLTFFSLIFKKFSEEQLLRGGKTNVISEDSLTIKEISFSSVKEPSGNIKTTVNYGGIPIGFTLSNGVIIQSELQNGLITYDLDGYDVPKKDTSGKKSHDIISSTAIENKGVTVKQPRVAKKVTYLFSSKNGTEMPAIPETCFQKVIKTGNSVSVTNTSSQFCQGEKPQENDTDPNLFEDSNSVLIINNARKIVQGAPNKNEMIKRLVKFVFKHIKDKNYKYGNLSASEVMKAQSGDCTEHSTLLSALLKSIDIPAKMAYGLVLDNEGKFFFHNWNVVYGDNGWINVDSTFGMEKADSSRIVLIFGSGTSQSREEVSLTVLKFMDNIEIAVTGFEYE